MPFCPLAPPLPSPPFFFPLGQGVETGPSRFKQVPQFLDNRGEQQGFR
jgi:hypothetical protein